MTLSVIFTTYNAPEWLEKVLWGYEAQTFRDFEVVVADDGSGPETRRVIEQVSRQVGFPVRHLWHEDAGFRKCEILNKAIGDTRADYLVFSDGDCIPRKDFLEVHARKREPGRFLSGGYLKLPMDISRAITREDILAGDCFSTGWLAARGLKRSLKNGKLTASGSVADILNMVTPTTASWNGHNASGWKRDILDVNGFDERMRYGALDREFGERLINSGVYGLQVRYSAICIHLDHGRGYKNAEDLAANAAIREATRKQKAAWTPYGIVKKATPEAW
jgi:glycosyltransferase involved in cell wall biosynthesis